MNQILGILICVECRSQGDEGSPSTAGAAAPRDRKTWEDPENAPAWLWQNQGDFMGKIRFQDAKKNNQVALSENVGLIFPMIASHFS